MTTPSLFDPKPVVFRDQEKIKAVVDKYLNGDSLTDEEYFMLERFWIAASEIVNIYPTLFGTGVCYMVRNKVFETHGCANNRRKRIKKDKFIEEYCIDLDDMPDGKHC